MCRRGGEREELSTSREIYILFRVSIYIPSGVILFHQESYPQLSVFGQIPNK